MTATMDEILNYGLAVVRAEDRLDRHNYLGGDEATALSDEALVGALWDSVPDLIPGDATRDSMYVLIRETLERWAPEAEWAYNVRQRRENGEEAEIEGDEDGKNERQALREAARDRVAQ